MAEPIDIDFKGSTVPHAVPIAIKFVEPDLTDASPIDVAFIWPANREAVATHIVEGSSGWAVHWLTCRVVSFVVPWVALAHAIRVSVLVQRAHWRAYVVDSLVILVAFAFAISVNFVQLFALVYAFSILEFLLVRAVGFTAEWSLDKVVVADASAIVAIVSTVGAA